MQAHVELIRRTLEQLNGQWVWRLVSSPQPGRKRLKVTAQNKSRADKTHSFIIDQELLGRLSPAEIAAFFCPLLEGGRGTVEVECRVRKADAPEKASTRAYRVLCDTYQADVRQLKADSRAGKAEESRPFGWARLTRNIQACWKQ